LIVQYEIHDNVHVWKFPIMFCHPCNTFHNFWIHTEHTKT